jgi:hypothetical protein
MAAMSKHLARSNKSCTGANATKKRICEGHTHHVATSDADLFKDLPWS